MTYVRGLGSHWAGAQRGRPCSGFIGCGRPMGGFVFDYTQLKVTDQEVGVVWFAFLAWLNVQPHKRHGQAAG